MGRLYRVLDAGLTWDENGYPVVTVPDAGEMTLFEMFPYFLEQGKPVIIGWNDWGGHYQVVIGYDNMGTETTADDVVIIADPYDTTDHLQDGYTTPSAERFIWDYSVGFELADFDYGVFVVASPEGYTYYARPRVQTLRATPTMSVSLTTATSSCRKALLKTSRPWPKLRRTTAITASGWARTACPARRAATCTAWRTTTIRCITKRLTLPA